MSLQTEHAVLCCDVTGSALLYAYAIARSSAHSLQLLHRVHNELLVADRREQAATVREGMNRAPLALESGRRRHLDAAATTASVPPARWRNPHAHLARRAVRCAHQRTRAAAARPRARRGRAPCESARSRHHSATAKPAELRGSLADHRVGVPRGGGCPRERCHNARLSCRSATSGGSNADDDTRV